MKIQDWEEINNFYTRFESPEASYGEGRNALNRQFIFFN